MEALPEGFKPVLFITGTFTTAKTWDDIAIATRTFALFLARRLGAHFIVEIGVETGPNSHFHMTAFSPDYEYDARKIQKVESRDAWGYGRIQVKPWKSIAGRHYVLKHRAVPMGGEVFHPCNSKACRNKNCIYQQF
jgi:hypothetical protein